METSHFKKVAVHAALRAGNYIRKNIGKTKVIRYKGEINIVTDIDKKAESVIVEAIRREYPSHHFLAEETSYKGSDLDFTWIIDPLDGTTNFLHGFPFFSVSVALSHRGNVVMGVVYDPTRDELFHAEKGKGAFLNRKRIHVSKVKVLKKALLSTGFAYNVKRVKNNNIDNFVKFMKASQAVRRAGSAAIDICYVACGRFDGFWELYLHPWDTAASTLIVKEADGRVTTFDSSKYNICSKEILATNSKIHAQMVHVLSGQKVVKNKKVR